MTSIKKLLLCFVAVFFVLTPVFARDLFLPTQQYLENLGSAVSTGQSSAAPVVSQPARESNVPMSMQSFKLKYVDATGLGETLKQVLREGETISINTQVNTIVVRARDTSLANLARVIQKMDVPPLQVQVEARLIELRSLGGDTNNPSLLGASWKVTDGSNNNDYVQFMTDVATVAASSTGLYAQLISGNVNAFLQAVERTTGYDLLASPWITALNHESAEILIGSKYGYSTTFTNNTGTLQNINFLEVGTRLKFTPHISEDGFIIMEVYPSVSEGSVKNNVPQEDTTETHNKVLVKDGQSIVIGGLTKNYNRQVEIGLPFFSALPFIGTFFRRTELQSEKRDIMIIITPHIVTPEFIKSLADRTQELDNRRVKHADGAKLVH